MEKEHVVLYAENYIGMVKKIAQFDELQAKLEASQAEECKLQAATEAIIHIALNKDMIGSPYSAVDQALERYGWRVKDRGNRVGLLEIEKIPTK